MPASASSTIIGAGSTEPGSALEGGGVARGEVGRVGDELVGDDADLDVVTVGRTETLLGERIAGHRGAQLADHHRGGYTRDGAHEAARALPLFLESSTEYRQVRTSNEREKH